MQPKYYDEWNNKYAIQIQKEYTEKMCKRLQSDLPSIKKLMIGQLEEFLNIVSTIQNKAPFEAGCIQGALLAWSARQNNPILIYEVFDEGQELGNVMAAKEYSIGWLFAEWQELENALMESIASNGYSAMLTKEAVYCVLNEQVKVNMMILSYISKYVFYDFDKLNNFGTVNINEKFYASIGAYRDYSKIIYRYNKGNEIFESGTDKNFDFGRFNKLRYSKKNIMSYSFKNAIFMECIFENINISGCDFTDCKFINCSFDSVNMTGGTISGCVWDGGKLKRMKFDGVSCKSGHIIKKGKITDICRKTVFGGVTLDDVTFANIDKEEIDFIDCIYENDAKSERGSEE